MANVSITMPGFWTCEDHLMGIDLVVPILRCPHCHASMARIGASITCSAGHQFDIARQGYVNFLGQAPPKHADTAEMVAARLRFLNAGHYQPIVDEIVGMVGHPTGDAVWLEAGAGPGWYLQQLLNHFENVVALASDISVAAVRRAARTHPRLAAIVSDTWRQWPVRTQGVDLILTVFAPRNIAEFARVLRPGGQLIMVVPQPEHLASLRAHHGLLNIDAAKPDRLAASMGRNFTLDHSSSVHVPLALKTEEVSDVIAMGPNAHHRRQTVPEAIQSDLSVSVLGWRRIPESA